MTTMTSPSSGDHSTIKLIIALNHRVAQLWARSNLTGERWMYLDTAERVRGLTNMEIYWVEGYQRHPMYRRIYEALQQRSMHIKRQHHVSL